MQVCAKFQPLYMYVHTYVQYSTCVCISRDVLHVTMMYSVTYLM